MNSTYTNRNPQAGVALPEYLLIALMGLLAITAIASFLNVNPERIDEVQIAMGGGSSTNNSGESSITGFDCDAAWANGIYLEELCPCGGLDQPPCPAFTVESELLGKSTTPVTGPAGRVTASAPLRTRFNR